MSSVLSFDRMVDNAEAMRPAALEPTITPLPGLRVDIDLLATDQLRQRTPVWTLHDPLRGKFYRIGWLEFEMLSRWRLGSAEAVLAAVNRETTLHASSDQLLALIKLLVDNELVRTDSPADLERLNSHLKRPPIPAWKRLFTFSMYYRRPVLNPDRVLQRTIDLLRPALAHRSLLAGTAIVLSVMALWGLSVHRYELRDTFAAFMSTEGLVLFALVLVLTNVLHEFGHGLVAKYYGCRVSVMGVALIFLLPVAYCDTTDAWRLPKRRQRLLVNAGGIGMELCIAVLAALAWILLPDGVLRTLAFFLALTSVAATLLVNLNPFMKFDGYYLLADSLAIDNLQSRSFALLRWQLRVWLAGSRVTQPEPATRHDHLLMCSYAACTWLYRLFLYLVIAVMIYHFWFKVLGVLMMIGVFSMMIIKPLYRETQEHVKVVRRQGMNLRSILTFSVLALLVVLVALPLPRKVSAPAVISTAATASVLAPQPAFLVRILVREGEAVQTGDVIAHLDDPDLQWQADRLQREIETLELRMHREQGRVSEDPEPLVTQLGIETRHQELAQVRSQPATALAHRRSCGASERHGSSGGLDCHQPGSGRDRAARQTGDSRLPARGRERSAHP